MGSKKDKAKTANDYKKRPKRRRPLMRKAYLCECPVCGDGLLRLWRFRREIVALCDECELLWQDPRSSLADPRGKADGSFPGGADRSGTESDWKRATRREVERASLDELVAGYSE